MTGVAARASGADGVRDHRRREPIPWLAALFCFVVPVLPTYVVLAGPLRGNGAVARILALGMLGLAVLGYLIHRRSSAERRVNPGIVVVALYLFAWLLIYGIGLLGHDNFVTASNRTRALIALLAHVGVAFYIMVRIRGRRDRAIVLSALAAGLTFACLVGFLQGVTSVDLRYFFQPPGFVLNTEDLALVERSGATRVRGTSQHPIEFSLLAAITIPLTIHLARFATRRWARVAWALSCVIAILALPASISRTGVISVVAAMLVYMLANKVRHILVAVGFTAIAIGIYVLAFPNILQALWSTITGSAEDSSIASRTGAYAAVGNLLREEPWFGLGLGGSDPEQFGYLDNEWMQALVQGGLVGLATMTILVVGALFGISAALRTASGRRQRDEAYMLGAMMTGIIAASFTFDLFAFEQAALMFFLVFALLWSRYSVAVDPDDDDEHPSGTAGVGRFQEWRRLVVSRSQRSADLRARRREASAASR